MSEYDEIMEGLNEVLDIKTYQTDIGIDLMLAMAEVKTLTEDIKQLRAELERYRWIPVTERLPRQNTDVLTYTQKMAMPIVVEWYNGYYGEDDNEWYEGWQSGRQITHWMQLPEPPKEGE